MAHKIKRPYHAFSVMFVDGRQKGRPFLSGAGVSEASLRRKQNRDNAIWNRKSGSKFGARVELKYIKKVRIPSRAAGAKGFPTYNLKY